MGRYALRLLLMVCLGWFSFGWIGCDSGGDDAGDPAPVVEEEEGLAEGLVAIGGGCDGMEGCDGCVAPCGKVDGQNIICTPAALTDNHDELVTPAWAKEYAEKKGVDFTIVRDYKFGGTYGALSNFSSSLPHQYVMDSGTMELLVGTGGTVNVEPEQAVCLQ